jgi:hypothetical protein
MGPSQWKVFSVTSPPQQKDTIAPIDDQRTKTIIILIIQLLGQTPEGWLAAQKPIPYGVLPDEELWDMCLQPHTNASINSLGGSPPA